MEKVVYLYHHLPKCGGVSFIRACAQWFPLERERLGSYPAPERIAEFARTRLDFDALPANCFVHGHLVRPGIRPFERYPDYLADGRFRLLTIIRDPLERCVSAYFHRQRVGRSWPEPLEHWLTRGRNQIARYLDADADNWRARLDAYFLIGTTESLQLTTNVFAARTGHPTVEVPHLNISPRDATALPADAAREFRQRNALDFEIFAYATERLAREARELGLTGTGTATP